MSKITYFKGLCSLFFIPPAARNQAYDGGKKDKITKKKMIYASKSSNFAILFAYVKKKQ